MKLFLISITFIFLTGCMNLQPTTQDIQTDNVDSGVTSINRHTENYSGMKSVEFVDKNALDRQATEDLESMLSERYSRWKDVKYRFGGDDRNGIDCSAFVQSTYKRLFGIDIPRTTIGQQEVGELISRSNLQLGDLIFFKTGWNARHVGIYMGQNEFLHSSRSKGVGISSLDNSYWNSKYRQAKRVKNNLEYYATQHKDQYMVASRHSKIKKD